MIHKLLAGKGKMKRGLSLLLCLALLGSSVISSNVTAEAGSEVESVEIVKETAEENEEEEKVAEETEEENEEEGEAAEETEEEVTAEETEEETVSEDISVDLADTVEEEATAADSEIQVAEENAEETPAEEAAEPEAEVTEAEETTNAGAVSTVEETGNNTQAANVSMYFEQSVSGVTVTAVAEAGAFTVGTEMSVVLLEADGDTADQYNEAADALDESGVSYDGFVAFDISFTLNGVEVEPAEDHSVSISLSMESELLDEDVDASSLEVHHITETDNGLEAEMVADTADAVDGTVEAAEDGSVAAEFTVDSFSTFTISYATYWQTYTINVALYDILGNQIDIEVNGGKASNDWSDISTIASDAITTVEDAGYTYVGARANAYNGTVITQLRYSNSGWQGGNKNSYNNITLGDTIYLVFAKTPTTIKTVDTSGIISINVYDYDQETVNNVSGGLSFGGSGYTGAGGGVQQGLVNNTLTDGYPTLSSNNLSLGYLFGTGTYDYKVENANYLFQIDEDGYYYYDSNLNYARLNTTSGIFTLYDVPRGGDDAPDGLAKFLPFNDLLSSTTTKADGSTNYTYYNIQGTEDYYFGMEISFTFVIGKDGQVAITDENGNVVDYQDMVFEFAGDDDVWVFIDDVLVLDLGGVHDTYSGSINFANDVVYVEAVNTGTSGSKTSDIYTTISEMFSDAEATWDGSDYSTHTLKFFYMERGAGGSNCAIRFNLQAIPEGTISFAKNLDYANVDYATDIEFEFKVHVDNNGGTDYTLYTGDYEIYDIDTGTKISGGTTGNDGIITLKHGQYATLTDSSIKATTTYYIEEIGATSDKYTVTLAGTGITTTNEKTSYTNNGVRTTDLKVNDNYYVTFNNTVQVTNQFNLRIDKEMKGGSDEDYSVVVKIGGVAYTGEYQLYESDATTSYTTKTATDGVITLKPGQYAKITGLMGGSNIEVIEDTSALGDGYKAPTYTISGPIATGYSTDGKATCTALEGTALGDQPVVNVVVTNALNSTTITVKKLVDGNMGDTNKEFTFTLKVGKEGDYYTDTLTAQRSDTTGTTELSAMSDAYTFSLSHNETIEITVPSGYIYTVTEKSYASEGYSTSYKLSGDDTEYKKNEGSVSAEGTITFTNTKYASAPTGLANDIAPYVAALAIALGGAVLMFISRRRRV